MVKCKYQHVFNNILQLKYMCYSRGISICTNILVDLHDQSLNNYFSFLVMDKWANSQIQMSLFIQGQCRPAVQETRDLWRLHNFKMRTLSSSHYHTKPSNLNLMKICWYKKTKDHHLNCLAVVVAMKNPLGALGDSFLSVFPPSSFCAPPRLQIICSKFLFVFRDLSVISSN